MLRVIDTPKLFFFLLIYFNAFGTCLKKWPIASVNDLDAPEKKVVDWIKKWTVPNTLNKTGGAWTAASLPKVAMSYDSNIKPAAYAAAIVTAWAISEGVYGVEDFYRVKNNVVCPWIELPAQLPPQSDFPVQIFSYSNCQGRAENLDLSTGNYRDKGDCSCTKCREGGRLIGPIQKCKGRDTTGKESDWQNGIFAMEQSHVASAEDVVTRAEKIYQQFRGRDYTYVDVLDNTVAVAGFPQGTAVYETIMRCFPVNKSGKRQRVNAGDLTWACADLVSMWLTRNHLVALTVAMTDNLDFLRYQGNLTAISVLAKHFN
jgi:hypothetical protein